MGGKRSYKDSKMYLILCGLSMSFMENQVLGKENEKIGVAELDLIKDYASVFGKGNHW